MTDILPIEEPKEAPAINIIEWDAQKKISTLHLAWQDLSKQIELVAGYENKTTISFATFVAASTYYISKRGDNASFIIAFAVVIILIAAVTNWFLWVNNSRLRWLCRSLVRVQQTLGMYTNDLYISLEELEDLTPPKRAENAIAFKSATVFDTDGQIWGRSDRYLASRQHMTLVWLVAFGAIISVLYFAYCPVAQTEIQSPAEIAAPEDNVAPRN